MKGNLNYLYELIQCNLPIDHWKYSMEGTLVEARSENARILDTLFSVGNIKSYMLEYAKDHSNPLILSSSLGNLWIAVFEQEEGKTNMCHVLGPVFTDPISNEHIKERVRQYDIPLSWKKNFIQLISQFPAVSWILLTQYTIMMHYTVTGEIITASDFAYQTEYVAGNPASQQTAPEEAKKSLPWQAEQSLFNNIRNGNLNYQTALSGASSVSSGVKISIGDPLRQAKDSGIVFAALCARAAIDGGLSAQSAYALQNMYSQSIEGARNVTEVAGINHQMYDDYIHRVHRSRQQTGLSPQIKSCLAYIEMHLTEKISIQNLAESVGYTDYYLSRKFKAEVGQSISEYVKKERIRYSCGLLETTELGIQEISDLLHFCSRSYFSDTFRREIGCAPAQYRSGHLRL